MLAVREELDTQQTATAGMEFIKIKHDDEYTQFCLLKSSNM